MKTVTYIGRADSVTWAGVDFAKGEPVVMDTDNHKHAHILAKAPGNPYFEVGGAESAPETADEDDGDDAAMRARLKDLGVTVPGRAGTKWMADKLEEIQNG